MSKSSPQRRQFVIENEWFGLLKYSSKPTFSWKISHTLYAVQKNLEPSLNSGFAGEIIRLQWSCQPIAVLLPDCGKQASNQTEAWHEKNAKGRQSGVKGRLRKARLQSSKTRSLGSGKTDPWDLENRGKHAPTCFGDKQLKSPYLASYHYPKLPKPPLNSS